MSSNGGVDMSNWAYEKHWAARQLANDYDHPREILYSMGEVPPWERLALTLGSALDEIERLRDRVTALASGGN